MKLIRNTRRLARIAIANVDTTVCDVRGNLARTLALAQQASEEQRCHLVVYPEQTLGGYPAEDLTLRLDFVRSQMQALLAFAEESRNYGQNRTVHVLGLTVEHGGKLFNCGAVVCGGAILGLVPKERLPTYGVFYDGRTTSPNIPGRTSEVEFELDNGQVLKVPFGDLIFDIEGLGRVAVVVCEDIWDPEGPERRRTYAGADLIVVVNSSPQRAGVYSTRREMLATRSADYCATLVYANQVGGNDGLVMDGGGFIFQCGRLLHEAPRFVCDQLTHAVVDLDTAKKERMANTTWRDTAQRFVAKNDEMPTVINTGIICPIIDRHADHMRYPFPAHRSFFLPADLKERETYLDELIATMVLSLDSYIRKTGVFRGVAISLSGGWDSALALLLARRWALPKRRLHETPKNTSDLVFCFGQPSRNNTETTTNIARTLAEECGATFMEEPISEAFDREAEALARLTGRKTGEALGKITRENIQARIRGMRMWGVANELGLCWIQTGNMTETFLGFTTVGGDQMGCFSLIGNLPKTVVMALVEHMAYQDLPMGRSQALSLLLHSKSSPGLSPGQTTEGDLLPFIVADFGMHLYLAAGLSIGETIEVILDAWTEEEFKEMNPNFDRELFREWMRRLFGKFHQNVFKWVFHPLTTHLGRLDLDRERALQIPVVHNVDWELQVDEALEALRYLPNKH